MSAKLRISFYHDKRSNKDQVLVIFVSSNGKVQRPLDSFPFTDSETAHKAYHRATILAKECVQNTDIEIDDQVISTIENVR